MTKLTLGVLPHTQWQPLAPLLKALGWQTSQSPEQWHSPASPSEGSITLLLYSHPILSLGAAMEAGQPPSEALAQWLEHTQQLVAHFKQHRQSSAILNTEQAMANPQALLELAQNRFKLGSKSQTPSLPEPEPLQASASHLLAHYLLSASAEAQQVLNHLEASTTPLVDSRLFESLPGINLDALQQQLGAQKTELEEENQLIIEQLHKVQEELERTFLKEKDTEKRLNDQEKALKDSETALKEAQKALKTAQAKQKTTEASLKTTQADLKQAQSAQKQLEKDHQAATTQNKDLEEENRLILDQLFKVQEELEQQYLKNQANTQALKQSETENARLQKQLDQAQQKIDQLTHSLSWRVTAPARALGKPFRKASPEVRSINNQIQVIRQANALDADWYTRTYPDVAENGADPIEHFVRFGAAENRNPSPAFDTAWYKTQYPDVTEANLNPLVHYIKFGQQEGRQPKP